MSKKRKVLTHPFVKLKLEVNDTFDKAGSINDNTCKIDLLGDYNMPKHFQHC